MSSKKIGIVGYGYVGKAMRQFFEGYYEVRIYDPILPPKKHPWAATKERINECDVAVICAPTPALPDGRCDTSAVEESVRWVECPLIVLKSTVPVGTTDRLQDETGKTIVFSPEYCGESTYWSPYKFDTEIKETPFFTFGGSPEATSQLVGLYLPITGPVKTYRQTTARAAELAKYMANTYFATKIAFCYEFAGICKAVGVDYYQVRELFLLDPRVEPMHTAVFEGNARPFSGKCLPKDLNALIAFSKEAGYHPELLAEVQRSNERISKLRQPPAVQPAKPRRKHQQSA